MSVKPHFHPLSHNLLHGVVLTCVEPGGVLPVELELDESEGEYDEADQRRGERREEAEPEPMVDPVVGEGAAIL